MYNSIFLRSSRRSSHINTHTHLSISLSLSQELEKYIAMEAGAREKELESLKGALKEAEEKHENLLKERLL